MIFCFYYCIKDRSQILYLVDCSINLLFLLYEVKYEAVIFFAAVLLNFKFIEKHTLNGNGILVTVCNNIHASHFQVSYWTCKKLKKFGSILVSRTSIFLVSLKEWLIMTLGGYDSKCLGIRWKTRYFWSMDNLKAV